MPKVLSEKHLFRGKIFHVKEVQVKFKSGKRKFEVLVPTGRKSVICVPVDEKNRIVMFKEFSTALKKMELAPPRGLIDKGETAEQAARRECQEEAGVLPKKLIHLATVTTSPGYMAHTSEIYLALNLTPSKLVGDEPDELEVIRIPLKNIGKIIRKKKITHASSIAALLLAEKYLQNHKL